MPTVRLAGHLRLYTSDDVVGAGLAQADAARHKGGDNDLVIVIGGEADTRAGQLCRLHQEGIG